jgi:hypothetical protein
MDVEVPVVEKIRGIRGNNNEVLVLTAIEISNSKTRLGVLS